MAETLIIWDGCEFWSWDPQTKSGKFCRKSTVYWYIGTHKIASDTYPLGAKFCTGVCEEHRGKESRFLAASEWDWVEVSDEEAEIFKIMVS